MNSMKYIIALAAITGLASAVIHHRNVRYSPCSPFLDSPEGQEYMRRMREYGEQHNGETAPENVRRRIMDEILQ